jgi:hypothetical protein
LSNGIVYPFLSPPIDYSAAAGIKLSPSSSSGRYGLKEDVASASSSDSDDQLHSDLDDSPRPLDRKTTPCFTPVDWRNIFSGAPSGVLEGTSEAKSKDSSAPEPADADVTRDQPEESDEGSDIESPVHEAFPGSFPCSFPSLRQSLGASYAGAQPLEQSYQGGSFLYDDDDDMHLETPPPEDLHSPSSPANHNADAQDLINIQSELNKVKVGLTIY